MRPESLNQLFMSVMSLPGVGGKTNTYIKKLLGSNRIKDLIFLKPSGVIDRRYSPKIKEAELGKICTLEVEVIKHDPSDRYKKVYSVLCSDETGFITLSFFKPHVSWLKGQLPVGEKRIVSGTIEDFKGAKQMTHPDFIERVENKAKVQTVEAVYPLTAGLSRKMLGKTVKQALQKLPTLPEWNDKHLMEKKHWLSWSESLKVIHNPENSEDIENNSPAKDRLAYDEILAMQLALAYVRHYQKDKQGMSIDGGIDGYKSLSPRGRVETGKDSFGEGEEEIQYKRREYRKELKTLSRNLRENSTLQEGLMWRILKNSQTGYKFRRQFNIDNKYIADFICLEKRLIVEIDGSQHVDSKSDKERTSYLERQGLQELRFWNNDIINNIEGVYDSIIDVLDNPPSPKSKISTLPQGESDNLLLELTQALPFDLTNAQDKAVKEILDDMKSPHKMMRLLQGDVGSGKTIVALFACVNAVSAGYQACIMAPTEILASQHFETISHFCKDLGIEIEYLSGRHKGKNREAKLENISSGKAKIIIGTHALFQESVEFKNLGFAVIDEQHRFGVHQRMMLSEKGAKLDCLVMSATPIPRTLTLTLYGDMDISILDEKPANRKDIKTTVMNNTKLEGLIHSLEDKIKEGEKIYWVCPLVEESEKMDLAAATDRFYELRKYFGDIVGLVHGRMKAEEKKQAMEDFTSGKTKILVATTVIEVGVDVKDASIMIIEHSERFGLSQLHQLRGRVGRGEQQSNCVLVYAYPISADGRKRLEIMRKTNDGFLIAEEDLSIRGGGEILGTKQSGIPEFKFADYSIHKELFDTARQDAKVIMQTDPALSSERGQSLRTLLYLFEQDLGIKYVSN
jgi:RecG-like helicase/very-short-patch-repair endonuclease